MAEFELIASSPTAVVFIYIFGNAKKSVLMGNNLTKRGQEGELR
jgi:hypothetical protein